MNLHERECIAGALGRVQNAQMRLEMLPQPRGVMVEAALVALALAEVDLRSLARAVRDEMRAREARDES